MEPESTPTFTRMFRGYDPAAVDAHIELLVTKQQLLLDDVESLRARLKDLEDEAASLRKEVDVLTDTSPSPHAVQQRMAKMLRQAVDEVAEMRAEAQAEAEALVTEMAAQREALEAELAGLRADAQQEREQLLVDAKQEADHYREEARRELDKVSQQRITILEQLTGVYRDLEGVPATLETAYQELKNPPDS